MGRHHGVVTYDGGAVDLTRESATEYTFEMPRGAVTIEADPAGSELHNIDIDLVGCKQFIKATVAVECTGGTSPSCTATCAIALGDKNVQPV